MPIITEDLQINAKDRANQTPLWVFNLQPYRQRVADTRRAKPLRHRAATTGSTGFINLLLKPPEGSPKTRLNTADRVGTSTSSYAMWRSPGTAEGNRLLGNTPLHLAMESAHAEAACLLIEAGADRERVSQYVAAGAVRRSLTSSLRQTNLDSEMPEDLAGVGGQEQRRAKTYVIERCGKR